MSGIDRPSFMGLEIWTEIGMGLGEWRCHPGLGRVYMSQSTYDMIAAKLREDAGRYTFPIDGVRTPL